MSQKINVENFGPILKLISKIPQLLESFLALRCDECKETLIELAFTDLRSGVTICQDCTVVIQNKDDDQAQPSRVIQTPSSVNTLHHLLWFF